MEQDNRANRKNPAVIDYRNPGIALPVADALTELLRTGARELLQQAVEAEVAEFVGRHRELKDERERQRIVCATATSRNARCKPVSATCR